MKKRYLKIGFVPVVMLFCLLYFAFNTIVTQAETNELDETAIYENIDADSYEEAELIYEEDEVIYSEEYVLNDDENECADEVENENLVGAANSYTITYVLNGGVNDSRNPSEYNTSTGVNGYVIIYEPKKDGSQFMGWQYSGVTCTKTKSNGENILYFKNSTRSNLTFTAVWQEDGAVDPNRTINFNSNGGTGSMNPVYIYNDSTVVTLPKCSYTREGYVFVGWTSSPNGSGNVWNDGSQYMFSSGVYETTLYAKWEEDGGFFVSFETLSEEMDEVRCTKSIYNNSLPTPTEETGYEFVGWFTDLYGKNPVYTYGELAYCWDKSSSLMYVYAFYRPLAFNDGATVYCNFTIDQDIYFSVLFPSSGISEGMYYTINGQKYTIDYSNSDIVGDYYFNKIVYQRIKIKINPRQINNSIMLFYPTQGDGNKWWNLSFEQAYKDYNEPIVNAILDYCAYAQYYFGDNYSLTVCKDKQATQNRIAAVTTSDVERYSYEIASEDSSLVYCGSSLVLDNRIGIRHYFYVENESYISGLKAQINNSDVTIYKVSGNPNCVYIEQTGINAIDLSKMDIIKIGRFSMNYGVYSYVNSVLESSETNNSITYLAKSIYLYGEAAAKYR